jgi:hypothetical protein
MPPGVNVDPLGKIFPNLVARKKPRGLYVLRKGKTPQDENSPPRGVLTQGNLKTLDVLLPPDWLGTTPKPLQIFHPKGTPTLDYVMSLIGLAEV